MKWKECINSLFSEGRERTEGKVKGENRGKRIEVRSWKLETEVWGLKEKGRKRKAESLRTEN
ncbi:hypothetical protein DMA11_01100 [Marinilabiliaceae bacterium JC017]|nr:hypothetical protein DMA11_01100 [Marinilabiliaceae bacterium JC017]